MHQVNPSLKPKTEPIKIKTTENISPESGWKSLGCIKSIHVWNDRQEPWHGPCLFSNRGWPEWIELGHRKHINWVRLNEPGMHQVNPCLSPDRNRETRFLSVVKLNGPVVICCMSLATENISTESDWKILGCIKAIRIWKCRQRPWDTVSVSTFRFKCGLTGPCCWPSSSVKASISPRRSLNRVIIHIPTLHQRLSIHKPFTQLKEVQLDLVIRCPWGQWQQVTRSSCTSLHWVDLLK